ncbi:MAG: glucose-6-phosphate isomerase [Clostridia bacterium]|nr:glucose-6-phosphate isomerase [Clostridia bacterium]
MAAAADAPDLGQAVGFPLELDAEAGELRFPAVRPAEVSARARSELRPVLCSPDAPGPDPAYRVYRDVAPEGERAKWLALGLRYDLTLLAPGRYGREFVKTFGHDHPERPGTGLTYPELYQVVSGRAVFLLAERRPPPASGFRRVLLVEAGAGEPVVIPPGFAHATANVGPGWLVLANWVARSFAADYSRVRAEGGLPARVLADAASGWRGRPSPAAGRMTVVPPGRSGASLRQGPFPVPATGPVWRLRDEPGRLEWLLRPEEHRPRFAAYLGALAPDGES